MRENLSGSVAAISQKMDKGRWVARESPEKSSKYEGTRGKNVVTH
jgi:hypothetical protein